MDSDKITISELLKELKSLCVPLILLIICLTGFGFINPTKGIIASYIIFSAYFLLFFASAILSKNKALIIVSIITIGFICVSIFQNGLEIP